MLLAAAAVTGALASLAPVVVHDSRERSPLASVAAATPRVPDRGNDRRPAVYARADGAWLQYWLFYSRQDQDRGIVRTGRHEGDWEMVQYRLDAQGRPVEAVYAQHSHAERCPWSEVERRGGRPVVHAANGSHASYFHAGVRDRTWPDPNDEADGRGRVVRPRATGLPATWIRWSGRWGAARAHLPGEQSSPRGPAFQPERWDAERWARSAHACRAGCDSVGECDGTEKALTAAAVGAPAAALLALWRRRRRRRPEF